MPELIEKDIIISGGKISALLANSTNPKLCVIETHGEIVGDKNIVAKYSKELINFCEKNNILYISYNPSHNGTQSEQKLEDVKFSKRVEELKSIIAYAKQEYNCATVLLGSSLGGLTSINAAMSSIDVIGIIINCGIIKPDETFKILGGKDFNTWQEKNTIKLLDIGLPYAFYEDINALDTEKNLENITVPTLWFSGEKDNLAPIEFIKKVAQKNSRIKLIEIPEGGHRFGDKMEPGEWENKVEDFITSLIPA